MNRKRPSTSVCEPPTTKPGSSAMFGTGTLVALLLVTAGCTDVPEVPSPSSGSVAFYETGGSPAATPGPCLEPGDPTEDAYDVATGPMEGEVILPNGRAVAPWGDQVFIGIFPFNVVVSPDGRYAYTSAGGDGPDKIEQVDILQHRVVASLQLNHVFHGLALDPSGTILYAAAGTSDQVHVIAVDRPGLTLVDTWETGRLPTGLALTPDGTKLLVATTFSNKVEIWDVAEGEKIGSISTDPTPYQIVVTSDGRTAYVSQWREAEVSILDLTTRRVRSVIETGKNPAGLLLSPDENYLYVAASDHDTVEMYDAATGRLERMTEVGSAAHGLRGVSPNSMVLSRNGTLLYVANAGDNAVEVYDARDLEFQGAIPTAWYPTAVTMTPDGYTLLVTNGKGLGAGPTPNGIEASDLMPGTLSLVPIPLTPAQLFEGNAQVEDNNTRPMRLHAINCEGKMFPIPEPGGTTPIKHVVLILRENKTYDAYLGDLEVGDGDPDMVLFGELYTPNTHQLAREFTVLDNFYTDSEDSDQGHLWTTAAFVNDFSERINAEGMILATGIGPGSDPETRYIFDALLRAGIDWVTYGEAVGLEFTTMHNIDFHYPGIFFNLAIPDERKARYVVRQIQKGVMPSFTYISLPNDHTHGTAEWRLSPESMVSDNDYGVGLLVEGISHSEYWESTAIFIFEDDPQDGADHVEAHRSPALVVSPWAKRGHVSSVQYSIASVLRTIELILDMPPLTQYDARATPMYDCFTAVPDFTPYEAIPRQVPDTYNIPGTVGAAESARMDFSGPDRAVGLGRVLWRYMKGTEPPPMFGSRGLPDDDDEAFEDEAEEVREYLDRMYGHP